MYDGVTPCHEHTLQELEHREKQYDGRERLDVFESNDDTEPALSNVLTFVATSKNMHWLGPASVEAVAQQIAAATGPSGPNYEYLQRLAEALWKVTRLHQVHCSGHVVVVWAMCCQARLQTCGSHQQHNDSMLQFGLLFSVLACCWLAVPAVNARHVWLLHGAVCGL